MSLVQTDIRQDILQLMCLKPLIVSSLLCVTEYQQHPLILRVMTKCRFAVSR